MIKADAIATAASRAELRAVSQPRRPALSGAVRSTAERLLAKHSVSVVLRAMTHVGEDVTYSQLDSVRRVMVREGRVTAPRERIHGGGGFLPGHVEPIAEPLALVCSAKIGSDNLLRRQLLTGKHWITDPARFREACTSVGLAA